MSVYNRWKWNYFGSPPTYLALLNMGFHVSTVTTAALLNTPAIIFLFKPTKWRQIRFKYVFWELLTQQRRRGRETARIIGLIAKSMQLALIEITMAVFRGTDSLQRVDRVDYIFNNVS